MRRAKVVVAGRGEGGLDPPDDRLLGDVQQRQDARELFTPDYGRAPLTHW